MVGGYFDVFEDSACKMMVDAKIPRHVSEVGGKKNG